jgi:hypothetical protein
LTRLVQRLVFEDIHVRLVQKLVWSLTLYRPVQKLVLEVLLIREERNWTRVVNVLYR